MEKSRRKSQRKYKGAKFTQAEPALIEGTKLPTKMKESFLKIIALLIIVGLNWTGLSAVLETVAYFNDTENVPQNLFQAALLDFSVTNRHIEGFIGMEALSEIEFASVVTKKTGSLNIQYEVNAEMLEGSNEDFCDALIMEAEHNGAEKHDGPLLSFSAAATTELGTWEFELDLPVSATNVPHGAECNVDLVFKGWRTDVLTFEESGFTDEERVELRLISRMIALNEFLPYPSGVAYGFDFGNDSSDMLQGEWVEIYNNSNFAFDLSGWYIKDNLEGDINKIIITDSNTIPAGTVINPNSWLVVYMNKAVFNNDGDTVKLFNQNNELIDSHTYTDNDYCEVEPTPGDENSSDTGGDCGGVPPNKSYARIPDGIGFWVDPVPTPGGPNVLEFESINQGEEFTEGASAVGEELLEPPENNSQEEITFDEIFNEIVNEDIEDIIVELPEIDIIETTTPLIEGIIPIEMEEDSPLPIEEEGIVEEEIIEETIEEQPGDEKEPVDEPEVVEVDDSGDSVGDGEGDGGGDGESEAGVEEPVGEDATEEIISE